MDDKTKKILLVEDNPGDVRLMMELLREYGNNQFSLKHADRIEQALDDLAKEQFDLALLDLSLPDGSGLETVRLVCGAAPHLPIIVLTGMDDDALAIEAVQAGAQDYLIKGNVNGALLIRSMNYAIERKKMAERMQFMAMHDSLTGLPNRALFQDRLTHSIKSSQRSRFKNEEKWKIAVMLIDLDNFKYVNDTFGHPQGDLLLQQIADRLQQAIRQSDTVARMGGDEFMLIFENVNSKEDIDFLGKKIMNVFAEPFQLSEQCLQTTASIGISFYPQDGEDYQSLMQTADIALYRAKEHRNCYRLFSDIEKEGK
jgi:diguanylate cyclase (GGDEF)-like protein